LRHLEPGARLLEVGAGQGELALQLADRGLAVTGIEPDPDAVAAAAASGAPVERGEWPMADVRGLDAIVFARSLHHVRDLAAAVQAAFKALTNGGLLLIEDFAWEQADASAANWLRNEAADAAGHGVLPAVAEMPGGELIAALMAGDDPLAAWRADHDHDLHPFAAMQVEVRTTFGRIAVETAPYLYRYFIPLLPASREAAEFIETVLGRELAAGARGDMALIGRRMVARAAW
ncbi:MAG: methyltransferase domain-containing protein, partial [Xanthomonadales bacterium]|nr:methyltransferase domain-containing protein [Xanthomonadales bacterium]